MKILEPRGSSLTSNELKWKNLVFRQPNFLTKSHTKVLIFKKHKTYKIFLYIFFIWEFTWSAKSVLTFINFLMSLYFIGKKEKKGKKESGIPTFIKNARKFPNFALVFIKLESC